MRTPSIAFDPGYARESSGVPRRGLPDINTEHSSATVLVPCPSDELARLGYRVLVLQVVV